MMPKEQQKRGTPLVLGGAGIAVSKGFTTTFYAGFKRAQECTANGEHRHPAEKKKSAGNAQERLNSR